MWRSTSSRRCSAGVCLFVDMLFREIWRASQGAFDEHWVYACVQIETSRLRAVYEALDCHAEAGQGRSVIVKNDTKVIRSTSLPTNPDTSSSHGCVTLGLEFVTLTCASSHLT